MSEEVKQQQDATQGVSDPAEPSRPVSPPANAPGSGGQEDSLQSAQPVTDERQADDEVVDLLEELPRLPRLSGGRVRTRRLVVKEQSISGKALTPEQRLLLLDTWRRSGLSGGEFEALVGISKHTLYAWKQRFERDGPAGLMPRQRDTRRASRLAQATQRAILMLKADNPDWGCQRISDVLARASGLGASATAFGDVCCRRGMYVRSTTSPVSIRLTRCAMRSAREASFWVGDRVAAILRSKALPVITILASAPLFFSFLLKTPPSYLKGYLFVFTWSWGVFGALLAPLCLVLECALLIWSLFVKPTPDRGVFVPHVAAVLVATVGLVILLSARQA